MTRAVFLVALCCAGCAAAPFTQDVEKAWHHRLALSRSLAIVGTLTPSTAVHLDLTAGTLDITSIQLAGGIGLEWNF